MARGSLMTRNEAAEQARRFREAPPEDWADYPPRVSRGEVIGYAVGVVAAVLCLIFAIYASFAADAAHEQYAPFCEPAECELIIEELGL